MRIPTQPGLEELGILSHPGPWTEEQYLKIPETNWPRIELVDGSLLMTSWQHIAHQDVMAHLVVALRASVPRGCGLAPIGVVNVRLGPTRIVNPDATVLVWPDMDALVNEGANAVLVAEVVTPATAAVDHTLRRRLYAEAGIPWYLRVEMDGRDVSTVVADRLEGDAYAEHARIAVGQDTSLRDAVAGSFAIDVDALPPQPPTWRSPTRRRAMS